MLRVVVLAAIAVIVSSCATPYQPSGITGGFETQELRPNVYRVTFGGNGFTTQESAQVYWLQRCAELAVEKGFTGFEILSDLHLVTRLPLPDVSPRSPISRSLAVGNPIPVSTREASDFTVWWRQPEPASPLMGPIRLAHGGGVFVYSGGGAGVAKPKIEGDVYFLTTPVVSAPPKIFNAKALLAQLDPIVNGEKCNGNVCPHVHDYLLPKGKLR